MHVKDFGVKLYMPVHYKLRALGNYKRASQACKYKIF